MSSTSSIVILHNIISPYKTLLFNEIYKLHSSMRVIYIAETENRREWTIARDEISFPHEILFSDPLDKVSFRLLFKRTFESLHRANPEILIIDGYLYASSWAGLLWARVNRRKVILWSSSNKADHERFWYRELPKKLFIKCCNAFNAYGTKSKEYLVSLGADPKRIFLTGNNTCNDFYYHETMKWRTERESLTQELGLPRKNFLYIGRFSKEKNILTLLNAFSQLSGNSAPEWGLILLGSGSQSGEIQEHIAENGIKNVNLPGFKQKEEIPRYFAVSDLLVLPSISEPWGLVVNEAMAAGLPVLVSRKCGCYPDIVKEGVTGFSFDPLNQQELYALMQTVVDDEGAINDMGRNSLELIKEFTPAKGASVVVNTVRMQLGEP